LGNESGTARTAAEYGLKHVPDIRRSEFGTPLVNDVFQKAEALAESGVLVYINADIILTRDFLPALLQVRSKFREFLMIGQRWDVEVRGYIDFEDDGWERALRDYVGKRGVLHDVEGIDYFAFNHGLWPEIPPFALGRCSWDNWLVWQPLKKVQPVIDVTSLVMAVHQNHGYSHVRGGKQFAWYGPEATKNRRLSGSTDVLAGVTASASWEMTGMALLPRPAGNHEKIKNIRKAQACHQLGVDLLEKGNLPEAIKNFDEAIHLCGINNSTISKSHLGKAIALFRLGNVEQAHKSVQMELSINPGHQPALRLLAQIESRARQMAGGAGVLS
jgi:tetratricopeptide (TPR) repeat protein